MKKPVREAIFSPQPPVVKSKDKTHISKKDKDMLIDNFKSGSNDGLDIIYNIVSILAIEFDRVTKVTEEEDECMSR